MGFKGGIPFLSTHLHITPCTFAFSFLVYSESRASNSDIVDCPRILCGLRMSIKEGFVKLVKGLGKGDYDKRGYLLKRELS